MLFIIEDRVYFRIDDGALWEKNDEGAKVILSPIVARLLHLFLLEKGRVVTREEIMNYVWEKHGLEPSNNSLNQYVSQLRKLMAHFQLPDETLRTVPREGFILSHELTIRTENDSLSFTPASLSEESHHLKQKIKPPMGYWAIFFLLLVLIATPVVVIFSTDMMHKQSMSITPTKIGHVGNCPVYAVLMGRNAQLNEALSSAKDYIGQNNISCNDDSILYFFSTGGVLKNQSGRAFLSHCYMKDNEIISCMDYAYHSWM